MTFQISPFFRSFNILIFPVFLFGIIETSFAQLKLPSINSDNMILQKNFEAPIWGWAEPGTKIVISASWDSRIQHTVVSNEEGEWITSLKTPEAGGPYHISINEEIIENVLIGEVWICSGQSNMQWAMENSEGWEEEMEDAELPDIRLFYVARDHAEQPARDCYGRWMVCTPESARSFSAVAYYFGKQLHQNLDVPIGLIHSSWGGSTAQAWVNHEVLESTPEGKYYIEKYQQKIEAHLPGIIPRNHQSPSGLYNAMLKPIMPYGLQGAIWYQGEANTGEHYMYKNLMEIMIGNWRDEWQQGDFPFYYVQLAPFNYQTEIIGAALRDQQRQALEIPNTGMAVTMDIGDPDDIHPLNKKDVGHRLALWALARTYGQKDLIYSGPLYRAMQTEGERIRLFFDHTGGGLRCSGERLTHFTVAGEDLIFHAANARIENDEIIVWSEAEKEPVAVRFAFENGDEPNLFNAEGLPASTFRTDNWKILTHTAEVKSAYNDETNGFIISMESASGGEIRYTLDGREPSVNSDLYLQPFVLDEDAVIKAKVYMDDAPSLLTTETVIESHLATGKKVRYNETYSDRYPGGGNSCLVNSVFGRTDYTDNNWQGFLGKDLDIIIDLENKKGISSVAVNCLQVVNAWILLPKELEVYISDDGLHFTKIATASHTFPIGLTKTFHHLMETEFETIDARYVKIVAKNYGPLPEWHQGAGNDSWIFADEVIIK